MNKQEFMPDVQGSRDERAIAINKVGIKSIRHPVQIVDGAAPTQASIATFDMYVGLPHDLKGTHMSRFVALLNERREPIAVHNIVGMLSEMVQLLEAKSGIINMHFPFFVNKTAPISGVTSLLDYEVGLRAEIDMNQKVELRAIVVVPVTSLCPCSKKISERGAHNQRSHVTVTALLAEPVTLQELISLVEKQASCELFGLLKRPDEKYVTERAYDNPKFVEDMVRDVAHQLNLDARILAYSVESENFESIHNHSAYAEISRDKRLQPTVNNKK